MEKINAVTNQKGGVGKTTKSIKLSACLAEKGKKVLLVDLDPQGNATSGSGCSAGKNTVYEALLLQMPLESVVVKTQVEGLFVAPSAIRLAAVEVALVNDNRREYRLRSALYALKANYDYNIIDCHPSLV